MAVQRRYRLNLRNYGNIPAIMVSQYDEGYNLIFDIYDGPNAASDLSAYTVTLKGIRYDELSYSFTGTVSTNTLTFEIDTTMTACSGKGTAEIAIADSGNDVLFATFNLPVYVEKAAVPDGSIDADVERAQALAVQIQGIVDTAAQTVTQSIADTYSSSSTYAVGDYCIYNNVLYKCTTAITTAESWTAGHWTVVDVTDEVSSLKSDLTNVENTFLTNVITHTIPDSAWQNGYITSAGIIRSSSLSKFAMFTMTAGQTLTIGTRNTNITIIGSTEADSVSVGDSVTIIQVTSSTDQYETYTYTATSTINIVVSVHASNYSAEITQDTILVTEEELAEVAEMSGATIVNAPVYGTTVTELTLTAGIISTTGAISSSTDYVYSQKLSVSEGDVVTPVSTVSGAYFRFICAYNGTTAVSASGASSGTNSYTVPSGIDGIIVCFGNAQAITSVSIYGQTGTVEKKYPIAQELGAVNWTGDLASGESVTLLASNVRFNTAWVFTGHISTVGKITIGVMPSSGTLKELCSVDATYLYYRLNDGSITSIEHGLTISEDLQIRLESPLVVNELGGITICSDGTEYTLSATSYGTEMTGAPYLLSTGAVMTDCAFSWIPKDIDKPIWIFGDSWASMYDTRWTYYMKEAGYTNSWMLNAYAGEGTDEAFVALENLLTIRKPEYIVWMMGMNNADSGAVNSVWKTVYDDLVELCTDYAINLILYTVPNTPTIDNSYKNAIVTASGYRYIDGVKAVGDDGNGNWFTGFEQSSSNHNHTSAKGARALFYRMLADFPEIAGNSL